MIGVFRGIVSTCPARVAVAEERDTLREENRRLVLEKDDLNAKLRELNKKLELYEEQAAWFKNKLYGRGSEQLTAAERLQIRLFDEIEHAADSDAPEDQAPDEPPPDQAAAPKCLSEPAVARGADRCRRRCRGSSRSSTCPSRTSSVSAATPWCASARTPPRSST